MKNWYLKKKFFFSSSVQELLDIATDRWGVKVERVEM